MPIILIILITICSAPFTSYQDTNVIEGRVMKADNQPLSDVQVLLQGSGYSPVGATYTDGAGRFRFGNLKSGIYYVTVEPHGTEYEGQSQRVEAIPFSILGRGEIFRADFVLRLKKSAGSGRTNSDVDGGKSIFLQEVPELAKRAYFSGTKSIEKGDFENAALSLKAALKIFPDYYDALVLLGIEYVKRGAYEDALPLLKRAVGVNKRGWESFYSLGITLISLAQREEGLKSLRRAIELNPQSINANMRLGIELAKNEGTHDEAMKVLKNVIKLAGDKLPEAYLALARLYSLHKKYLEAADELEAYRRTLPKEEKEQRALIKQKIDELRKKNAGAP